MMDTGDKNLDRFRPSGEVIPYVLYWCIFLRRVLCSKCVYDYLSMSLRAYALRGLPAPLIKGEEPSYMTGSQPTRLGFP